MWQCGKCHEEVDESFNVCWNCGTALDGTEDPDFVKPDVEETATDLGAVLDEINEPSLPLDCFRCQVEMTYRGTRRLYDHSKNDLLLDIVDAIFTRRDSFDIYVCDQCGRVEFFLNGVGERFRPN